MSGMATLYAFRIKRGTSDITQVPEEEREAVLALLPEGLARVQRELLEG